MAGLSLICNAIGKTKLGPAIPLFIPVGRQRKGGGSDAPGKNMARGDHGGMEAVFPLGNDIIHPLAVGKIPGGEYVGQYF